MAKIIQQYEVSDGFDVEVLLQSGARHIFHFAFGEPANIQTAVDAAEAALIAASLPPESTIEVEAEDGTIV